MGYCLSIYSIIWALPVVVFISISTNIVSESHLKSYIVWSIDRVMTKVGLTGYDIVPVIEGFGCNLQQYCAPIMIVVLVLK